MEGLSGGILSAMLYSKIKGLKFLAYFDMLIPSVALAQGVWKDRVFPGRMLFWKGDGQPVWHCLS